VNYQTPPYPYPTPAPADGVPAVQEQEHAAPADMGGDEDFKRKVKALIRSREQYKQQNTDLQAQVQQLTGDLAAARSAAASASAAPSAAAVEAYTREIARLNDESGRSAAARTALETENRDLRQQLAEAINRVKTAPAAESDEDVSKRLGKLLLEAHMSAQRITQQAEADVGEIYAQARQARGEIMLQVHASQQDVTELKNALNSFQTGVSARLDAMASALAGAHSFLSKVDIGEPKK